MITSITLLLCEVVSRLFISHHFRIPFWQPQRIIYSFYPELENLPTQLNSAQINVLILGGSAVSEAFTDIAACVTRQLKSENKTIAVYNLAQIAHTSFDSRVKFKHCGHLGFNYVFVYDNINDTRLNNCPSSVFKSDYSHVHFYSQIVIFEKHAELRFFTLPFLVDFYWNELKIKTGLKKIIPREYFVMNEKLLPPSQQLGADTANKELLKAKQLIDTYHDRIMYKDKSAAFTNVDSLWWHEGATVKTTGSLYNNLLFIYNTKPASSTLILCDYAWYNAPNYSLHKFLYDTLDYREQRFPTEIYGQPDNVVKGLKKHNAIIDSIARAHHDIVYFNFNDSIPHNAGYFNDICHLTDSGQALLCTLLVQNIADIRKTYTGKSLTE